MEKHRMIIRRSASWGLTAALVMTLFGTPALADQTAQAADTVHTVDTLSYGGAAILQNITDPAAKANAYGGAAILADLTQEEQMDSELNSLLAKITGETNSEDETSGHETGTTASETKSTEDSSSSAQTAVTEEDAKSTQSTLLCAKVSVSLNVRAKASKKSSIVGILYRGCKAKILKKKGKWYKIQSGKVTGWVRGDYVKTGAKALKYLKKVNPKTATVTGGTVNIRKKPGTDSDVLLKVKKGRKFMVLKKYGDWVKIRVTPDLVGWIHSDYVKVKKGAGTAVKISLINKYTLHAAKLEAKRKKQAEKAAAKAAAKSGSGSSGSSSSTSRSSTSASDLDVLAAICEHEAGDSYEGCLAVANVVLNRVHSSDYPNTIKGVIYQSGQFMSESALAPYVARGSSSTARQAAQDALNGSNNVGNRKSFRASWYARGRNYPNSIEIGDNVFF